MNGEFLERTKKVRERILKILENSKEPLTAKHITAKLLLSDGVINTEEDIDKLPYKERANEVTKVRNHLTILIEQGLVKKSIRDPIKGRWKMAIYKIRRKRT